MEAIATIQTEPGKETIVLASTAFGCRRDFLDNRFVYTVVSPRARGLSIGVNLNPDKHCNFDCAYCEVNRDEPALETALDVAVMDFGVGRARCPRRFSRGHAHDAVRRGGD